MIRDIGILTGAIALLSLAAGLWGLLLERLATVLLAPAWMRFRRFLIDRRLRRELYAPKVDAFILGRWSDLRDKYMTPERVARIHAQVGAYVQAEHLSQGISVSGALPSAEIDDGPTEPIIVSDRKAS